HDMALTLEGDAAELLRYDPRPRGGFALECAPGGSGPGALAAAAAAVAEMKGPDLFGWSTRRLRLLRPLVGDSARCDVAAVVEARPGCRLDLRRSFEILEDGAFEAGVVFAAEGRAPAPFIAALRFDLSVPGGGLDERRF